MGRASKRKRERRQPGGLKLPRNLPADLRGARVHRNHDRPKISESLGDLIRPYTSDNMDIQDFRGLVSLGGIAWNLSILEDSSPGRALDLLTDVEASEREWLEPFIANLVSRKRSLFPDDDRLIAGWDVIIQPDGRFFLTVAGGRIERSPES